MTVTADTTRLQAVSIVSALRANNGSLSSLLEPYRKQNSPEQQALLQAICFGVCRHYEQLLYLSTQFLKKPLRKKDEDISCLMLIGIYQLLYMNMPDYAVVNECVESCRKLKKNWAKNLLNAVLRSVQREGQELLDSAQSEPSIHYSHPQWLIRQLAADWPEDYLQILEANNIQGPMTLRVNQLLTSRQDYLQVLASKSISAHPGVICDSAVILEQACDVNALPGFSAGLVSVQDEASQVAAQILQVRNSDRVLDACAAPGGKSCAILEYAPEAQLLALDNSQSRLDKVRENLQRIGLRAELLCADLLHQAGQWRRQELFFDRILLDVPCSATGVIRRHPDIKLLRQPDDIEKLKVLQQAMLLECWPLLKPGGKLLYTSCSLLQAENNQQIQAFLHNTPDAAELDINLAWGHKLNHGRQLFPSPGAHDGFYYALLQKC
ncbi:MAG: 16S rRNA (cytosine(967)-C(5))-methyltransferase [Gammaproteobacteria bacterium]|nr:16S rRNA (cytosine(967)-C(5))-methyltransferase [Gammaproteobacteria bacterium]